MGRIRIIPLGAALLAAAALVACGGGGDSVVAPLIPATAAPIANNPGLATAGPIVTAAPITAPTVYIPTSAPSSGLPGASPVPAAT